MIPCAGRRRGRKIEGVAGPTYKPREALRTRRSGEETEGSDFAATALDRPVADMHDLERAKLMERVERDRRHRESRGRARRVLIVALVAALAVGLVLGVALGTYLALS